MQRLTQFFKKNIANAFVAKCVFVGVGVATMFWFVIRVVPKPQRAFYPCMQAAAPIMSAFIIYILTLSGTIFSYLKMKQLFREKKFILAYSFVGICIVAFTILLSQHTEKLLANDVAVKYSTLPNSPIGVERGIFPGRVVWTHNKNVATFDGTGNWYDDSNISQTETVKMLTGTLCSLTEKQNEKDAWNALFMYFNKTQKGAASSYKKGEKIAIKINENNALTHEDSKEINATPQVVYAVVASLVNQAGVPQNCITVFDASRFVTNNVFNKIHNAFPEVIVVDNIGGDGRVKATYIESAIKYSVDNGKLATGLATCAVDANYLINIALLKGHVGQGVTLCAKNYYGATSIFSNWKLNSHSNFNQDKTGKPKYMTFVDFLGHKDLGEKTMLFLIDGLYGTKDLYGVPVLKWKMEPFNNAWACSFFASQDGVAVDAVGLDFLSSEFPDAADMSYSDQYLVEAALANNPPSNSFYDPERDSVKCKSLGVMEHWNNPIEKKYSRNLGKNYGIELVRVSQ
jgi:hypothetical protein